MPRPTAFKKSSAAISGRKATSATVRTVEVDDTPPEGILPAPEIGAAKWIVATVSPRQDARAVASLREAGYPVFQPLMTKWRRKGFKKSRAAYPLFPGYLFVGLVSGPRYGVTRCERITSIVSSNGKPIEIQKAMVESLSAAMMRGDFDETVTVADKIRAGHMVAIGDRVSVNKGMFAAIDGTITKLLDHERVAVLITFLGSEREVIAETTSLKKIA